MLKVKFFLKEYVVLVILVLFMIIASLISDKFFTVINITNVLRQTSMIIIIGSVVNLLMVSGGIDLSIGSIVGLSAAILARLVGYNSGFPFVLAIIIAIFVGLICGMFNGFLVVNLNVNPIIATLGTLYIFRGLVYIVLKSQTIGTGFPQNYSLIGQGYLWIIPIPVIIMLIIFFIFLFIEVQTLLGKYSYAVGGNEQAAILSGVPVKLIKFILYSLVGLMSGIAGFIITSRANSANPDGGMGMEFDVILAILLGGTVLGGGKGSVKGMIFGALILGVVGNGMNLLGLSSAYKLVVMGIVFIIAIVLNKLIRGEKILEFF